MSIASPVRRRTTPSLTLLLCLATAAPGQEPDSGLKPESGLNQPADRAAELESVRTRIKDIETSIQTTRVEVDQFYRELRENEVAAGGVAAALRGVEKEIRVKTAGLDELRQREADSRQTLAQERSYLAQQVRASYITGRNDYLKLLLNQEDPALIGRMLGYYEFYNRSRTERIDRSIETIDGIKRLMQQIAEETGQLEGLRAEQLTRLRDFEDSRESRREIISRLENSIEQQDRELGVLQANEQKLSELVSSLGTADSVVRLFEDLPPFDSLRGKLKWPVDGSLTTSFGAARKGGKLKWQGVTISAERGSEVRAVSPGKIIFADWFRNLGLLIILDHGSGYMSLYGHNEQLSKKVGDWVSGGEIIAKVGDSGGQESPNLYFEIRAGGNPINPGLWCRL